jgi:Glycosyl hydrolase family 76
MLGVLVRSSPARRSGETDDLAANVKTAASSLADSCMAFYHGDQPGATVGLLPPNSAGDFNWWESGAFWGLVRSLSIRSTYADVNPDDRILVRQSAADFNGI